MNTKPSESLAGLKGVVGDWLPALSHGWGGRWWQVLARELALGSPISDIISSSLRVRASPVDNVWTLWHLTLSPARFCQPPRASMLRHLEIFQSVCFSVLYYKRNENNVRIWKILKRNSWVNVCNVLLKRLSNWRTGEASWEYDNSLDDTCLGLVSDVGCPSSWRSGRD